jgi:hypothetical protein
MGESLLVDASKMEGALTLELDKLRVILYLLET